MLVIPSAHPHITSDPNTAALFGYHTTERRTLCQTWELLCAVYDERFRLDLQSVGDMSIASHTFRGVEVLVVILGILELLVQAEAEPVLALMADREVREDEIACRFRPVQVDHTRHGGTSQNGQPGLLLWHAAIGNWTSLLQGRKQKVVCVHVEGNVIFGSLALVDFELNNWWRIHRSAVCRS